MITTPWKVFNDGKSRIKATYGFNSLGGQEPYFSITAVIMEARARRWRDASFGCLHDDIEENFPELRPLIKWHLCNATMPMHYYENAMYFARLYKGLYRADYEKAYEPDSSVFTDSFKRIVVYGVVENDSLDWLEESFDNVEELDGATYNWCEERLPQLMERFRQDCLEAGLEFPTGRTSRRRERSM